MSRNTGLDGSRPDIRGLAHTTFHLSHDSDHRDESRRKGMMRAQAKPCPTPTDNTLYWLQVLGSVFKYAINKATLSNAAKPYPD
jgi:hypothetical protein